MENRLEGLRMVARRTVRLYQVRKDGNLVQGLGHVSEKKEMNLQRFKK